MTPAEQLESIEREITSSKSERDRRGGVIQNLLERLKKEHSFDSVKEGYTHHEEIVTLLGSKKAEFKDGLEQIKREFV